MAGGIFSVFQYLTLLIRTSCNLDHREHVCQRNKQKQALPMTKSWGKEGSTKEEQTKK